jgi:hypothetical protein
MNRFLLQRLIRALLTVGVGTCITACGGGGSAADAEAFDNAGSRQAEQLERALGEGVIRVNVECCGVDGVEQALGIAYGMQAAGNLPNSAPVLVRSDDLRLGAVAVKRLSEAGYANVRLVSP